MKTIQSQLDHNMALLREHQTSHGPLAGKLDYSYNLYRTPDAVWQSIQQSGALSLMPHDELRKNVYLYEVCTSIMEAVHAFYTQAEIAGAIPHLSPDGNLLPRDTEELITATSETNRKLAYAAKFLGYEATGLQKAALFDHRHAVLGLWMIDQDCCGLGIRESAGPITGNLSSFVPHFFT